jgi:hypothetical protein
LPESIYSLTFPQGFDDYASEVEAKGWFAEATLSFRGRQYRLSFYDAARLRQEIESEFQRGSIFFEPNLVVLPAVTRQNMEKAIDTLIRTRAIGALSAY